MDSFTSLIFGIINFLILCALLYWLLGSSANHFFYTRREKIRKEMFNSVMILRHARGRLSKNTEHYEHIPADIKSRKDAISRHCNRECEQIIEDAHKKAEHMLKAGERQAAEERKRHATLLRERLMRAAFRIAEERMRKADSPEMQRKYVEKGFEDMKHVESSGRIDVQG